MELSQFWDSTFKKQKIRTAKNESVEIFFGRDFLPRRLFGNSTNAPEPFAPTPTTRSSSSSTRKNRRTSSSAEEFSNWTWRQFHRAQVQTDSQMATPILTAHHYILYNYLSNNYSNLWLSIWVVLTGFSKKSRFEWIWRRKLHFFPDLTYTTHMLRKFFQCVLDAKTIFW